jgi:DNA mismatch repair protein MutL
MMMNNRNSLDANSTNIEVKMENGGVQSVTVSDNGKGIEKEDREAMGLRYYTSKIDKFRDLERCVSYGFRGEALNSLCALGDVVITTKTERDSLAMEYALGPDGAILSEKPSSFGTGTTVVVSNIFHGLPVRRQVQISY